MWSKRATPGRWVRVRERLGSGCRGSFVPAAWTTCTPGSVPGMQCWQEAQMSKAGSLPSRGTCPASRSSQLILGRRMHNYLIQTLEFL